MYVILTICILFSSAHIYKIFLFYWKMGHLKYGTCFSLESNPSTQTFANPKVREEKEW